MSLIAATVILIPLSQDDSWCSVKTHCAVYVISMQLNALLIQHNAPNYHKNPNLFVNSCSEFHILISVFYAC